MKDPAKSDDGGKAARPEQSAVYKITSLEQIKVVADPLRLRILECFSREEQTTKQVAQKIGEKPTRLYHHVELLERVGLIRRTRTRQNRGTLEKYYLAVARCFEAGPGLFSGAESGSPFLFRVSSPVRTRNSKPFISAPGNPASVAKTISVSNASFARSRMSPA